MKLQLRICAPLLLAAVLLPACSGDAANPPRGPGRVSVSCQAIDKMESYRYSVKLKMQSPPAATAADAATGTPAPLGVLAEALQDLFSDFSLEGAFVAPDRSQAILRFESDELELRSVGGKSWLRVGAIWQTEASQDMGLLTPAVVCRDIVTEIAPSLIAAEARPEQVGGIPAEHYTLDETQLRELPAVLGESRPRHYVVDIWLAQEGRWPVQMKIESSDVNEKGEPLTFSLLMVVRDVGDRGIRIEPPVAAGGDR